MNPKNIKILYWVFTLLFAAFMTWSSVPSVVSSPDAIKFQHDYLGYPNYFIPFIGVAKLLGIVAILIPGFPRIKEWAYAGLFFDLAGAIYSIFMTGKPDISMLFMLVPVTLGILSYVFYHKKLKVASRSFAL
ncbi:MAG: DoxX family protein [Chitinophagaceae bacterium]|nr:MAG: DoxX family protein [Chitinophagaceae bacterium]